MGEFKPPHDERQHFLADPPNPEWWDRSRRGRFRKGWRREIGTRSVSGLYGGNFLDGGRDAPLDRRGLEVWHLILAAVVVLGAVVIVLARVR